MEIVSFNDVIGQTLESYFSCFSKEDFLEAYLQINSEVRRIDSFLIGFQVDDRENSISFNVGQRSLKAIVQEIESIEVNITHFQIKISQGRKLLEQQISKFDEFNAQYSSNLPKVQSSKIVSKIFKLTKERFDLVVLNVTETQKSLKNLNITRYIPSRGLLLHKLKNNVFSVFNGLKELVLSHVLVSSYNVRLTAQRCDTEILDKNKRCKIYYQNLLNFENYYNRELSYYERGNLHEEEQKGYLTCVEYYVICDFFYKKNKGTECIDYTLTLQEECYDIPKLCAGTQKEALEIGENRKEALEQIKLARRFEREDKRLEITSDTKEVKQKENVEHLKEWVVQLYGSEQYAKKGFGDLMIHQFEIDYQAACIAAPVCGQHIAAFSIQPKSEKFECDRIVPYNMTIGEAAKFIEENYDSLLV